MNGSPAHDRDRVVLSDAGASRRDAMLGELLGELGRVRRRRVRRRALGGAGALALAILAVAVPASVRRPGAATDTVTNTGPDTQVRAEPTGSTGTTAVIVATDPTILERYGFPVAPTPEMMLPDDAALLAELAAIARPAGIIRTGGRVRVTGGVVDEL